VEISVVRARGGEERRKFEGGLGDLALATTVLAREFSPAKGRRERR